MVSAEDLNLPVDQADKHLPTEVHLGRQSYIRVKLWKIRDVWDESHLAEGYGSQQDLVYDADMMFYDADHSPGRVGQQAA